VSKWLSYNCIDMCSPVKGTHRHQYERALDLGAKLRHRVANGTLGEWF
jgi:hypothetical protein